MKKVLSLVALAVMVVSLTGCLDDPDGAREKISAPHTNVGL